MTTFGYIRVGGATGRPDRFTVEQQEELIGTYANKAGLPVAVWLRDRGISGFVPFGKRDKGSRLLDAAVKGDVVIVCSFDRLFKTPQDALSVLSEFKARGVDVQVADLGGSIMEEQRQKILLPILEAISEQKRARVSARTAEAKQELREEGKFQGGKVPFGYEVDDNGFIVPNKEQQASLKFMQEKRSGGLSYRAISELLKKEHGVTISHAGVRKILMGDRKTPI